ncbi:E3 ubiquitin-protein ligase TOM1 [Nakaseomyces bracarensis]|uniref:E3 ubiquitin-protein ligase TOM1 n=1 Tax=Nakaseomyces bracarensis TaxID=273131 RepID=UPI0038711B94
MVKLTRFEKLQKEKNAESFKPLLDDLSQCTEDEFVDKLDKYDLNGTPRNDLFVWIPILNRIDDILSRLVDKYNYKSDDFKKNAVPLKLMDDQDVDICVRLSDFSTRLLCNTENRYIYSSMDVMSNLLNCPNYEVKLGALKVLGTMGERYVIARERIDASKNVLGTPHLKSKALKLALAIPSSAMDENGEHFALPDLYFEKKKYPAKWSKLRYSYYSNNKSSGHNNTAQPTKSITTGTINNTNNNENTQHQHTTSMNKFSMNAEELSRSTLQQIFDKGMKVIAPEDWFEFSLKATVAKAFSDDSEDCLKLRDNIIRTKMNAIALINTVYVPPQVSSKFFEVDPYAFNSLTDFISLSETKISSQLRLDALFALECISLKHVWCSDIMRNLGGNMSHGLLFQILRYLSKILREKSPEVDEIYNIRFFYLISNLADVKVLHESLLAAGLVPNLLDIVSIKNLEYRRTLASATHLLEVFINDSDSTAEFINNGGFTTLINSIDDEVNFALEHPDYGEPPKYFKVYYKISFRQLSYIRSNLKLVIRLLKTDSGDRIRNLIDSPILGSLKKILENRELFGYTLVTHTLDIIQRVINSEPTIYPILFEAGLISYIIDNFEQFLGPYSDLLILLPDVLSAICLNNEGLQKVREKKLIRILFRAVTDLENASVLSWKEESVDFGTSMDELARHYPELQRDICDAFCDVIKELPSLISFDQPFIYESDNNEDLIYHSKSDKVLRNEENGKELAFWDIQKYSPIIDCFSNVFYGMTLENSALQDLPEKLDFKTLFKAIILDRIPFDFTTSQTMLNYTDVLQLFDEHFKNYAFPSVLEILKEQLIEISDFLEVEEQNHSILLTVGKGKDTKFVDNIMAKLSKLLATQYIVTNVYLNITTLTPYKFKDILKFFENDNLILIDKLRLLFQRCALEESFIRKCLPDEVAKQTMPDSYVGNTPPIQIHVSKPKKEELKDDGTAAKFKNTFEIRSILNKLQSTTAILFRCFLRVKATDPNPIERQLELSIYDRVVENILQLVKAVPLEDNLKYALVVLNFNTFVFTFPKTSITANEVLQTVPSYLFYQKGGYDIYEDLIVEFFGKMSEFSDITSIEEIDYVKDTKEVLILSCVINALTFFNKPTNIDTMELVPSIKYYYEGFEEDVNLTKALMGPVKVSGATMIKRIDNKFNLFNPISRTVPYAVFKQILTLLKNLFSPGQEAVNSLYSLDREYIPTSANIEKFLVKQKVGKNDIDSLLYQDTKKSTKTIFEELKRLCSKVSFYDGIPRFETRNTTESLTEIKGDLFYKELPNKVFNILPYYPKLVNAFARTLIQILSDWKMSGEIFAATVLEKVVNTSLEDDATLSSLIHLFGIFLNEKSIYQKSEESVKKFLNYLSQNLKPQYVNAPWFSKALYAYEIILAKSEIPEIESLNDEVKTRYKLWTPMTVFRIPEDIKKNIFDVLIRVNEISSFYSALATSRILIFYARDEDYASEITHSGILSRLLKVVGMFQKSEKINFLESSFLLLIRRCFETSSIISYLIRNEIQKSFTTRPIGNYKERERELSGLLEEKPHVVMRNPSIFVDILCENARFSEFDKSGHIRNYIMKRNFAKSSDNEDMIQGEMMNQIVPSKRTNIIHLLLSQLMAASEKDWLSEPAGGPPLNPSNGKSTKVDPARNPVCAYMICLLKMLLELICSYKQCKFEFLTYNRRNVYAEKPKPRVTALNFFLYKLIDKSSGTEKNAYAARRKEVISTLARSVIVGFVADTQGQLSPKPDLNKQDPDMMFIRKFTIESVIKVIKTSITTPKILESNIHHLESWFKIISSLVYVQAPYLRSILDTNKIEADQYQICKLMIELGVPTAITDTMASLDLNYPFSRTLFNEAVDALNAINFTRNNFSDLFKIESHEEEEDEEEDSEKEDTQDMFRNSALGMYDVEDIEEDDDDDDDEGSLIGEDDGIAFVDSEEGGFEVVFSDESENEHDEEDGNTHSDFESTSGNENGIEIHVDEVMDSQDGYSGSEGSDSDSSDDSEGFSDSVVIDENEYEYDSDIDLELEDYEVEESDWESGLSDFSSSEDGNDEDENELEDSGDRRNWHITHGIDLLDDNISESERGVFQGIEHVFQTESQPLFRVQNDSIGRHHDRSFRRNHGLTFGSPALTLFNSSRRSQNNLINPLGPSGLEQVENDITDQLSTIGSGTRPRTERATFDEVLFSGELFDERPLDGIILKSSVARWKDIYDMFYDSKGYANCIVTKILNRIYNSSLKLFQEKEKKIDDELWAGIKKAKEQRQRRNSQRSRHSSMSIVENNHNTIARPVVELNTETGTANDEQTHREPIFVNIDGRDVDISGTDIDPEFLNALPEEMRAEVFAEHVRERRAEAMQNNIHIREIDSDFLEIIPDEIRNEILEEEEGEARFSRIVQGLRGNSDTDMDVDPEDHEDEDDEDREIINDDIEPIANESDIDESDVEIVDTSTTRSHLLSTEINNNSTNTTVPNEVAETEGDDKKKNGRIYFLPLVDRAGIAALMKAIFISQPYIQREVYHELFYRLCSSKQNRGDIINVLLFILSEAINDQASLEKVYNSISARAVGKPTSSTGNKQLPPDCTPLTVANQTIEILQNLIDADGRLKYFFITEHDNLFVNKISTKLKKDVKSLKFPIQYLFMLLDKKIITDETVLMDLLTRILQVCSKPIATLYKKKEDKAITKKKIQFPTFDSEELKKIVSIINLDSCNTRVFQQTINIMQNLSAIGDNFNIFISELIEMAKGIVPDLSKELDELRKEGTLVGSGAEINSELVQKFTIPSSNQAKLLKVLTVVDYLHSHRQEKDIFDSKKLTENYSTMHLGPVWVELSRCLLEFEKRKHLSTSATILLPLIESLMVVCRYSKSNKMPVLKYEEEKNMDFQNMETDELFFHFTDLHKRLLNQMVRSNPKLMSGPFSSLVKNPKILDFDNKRYYFTAKIKAEVQEAPKLSITVRREQVFLDSYRALFFKADQEIRNCKLDITFKGESGVDAGGVTREWYQVLSRQMFNPDYALFLPVASDKTTFRPNRTSGINPEHLSFFKFIGMVIGKAIRDQCFLDCHFSREVYKNILGKPVSLKDMESLDLDYYKSLVWILENDITDIIEETFSVETDDYGEHKIIDLIENGRNIPVTEENKHDYVKKIVEYKLHTSVKEQMDNFLKGFYALIPQDIISIFDEQELELLVSGLPDIDVDDWKNNTTYVNYTANCKQVNYFWRAVRSFDAEEKAKLLQFITGTSKVPLNGFKELSGVNGVSKFSIHRDYGSVERLPSSHTCFNQLNLPAYASYETLRGSILLAINEGHEGFGLA